MTQASLAMLRFMLAVMLCQIEATTDTNAMIPFEVRDQEIRDKGSHSYTLNWNKDVQTPFGRYIRIYVWTNASTETPLFVTVRNKQKDSADWKIPHDVSGQKLRQDEVRTMCMDGDVVTIGLFSHSPETVSYHLNVTGLGSSTSQEDLFVRPFDTVMKHYIMTEEDQDKGQVLVLLESPDDRCAVIVIDPLICTDDASTVKLSQFSTKAVKKPPTLKQTMTTLAAFYVTQKTFSSTFHVKVHIPPTTEDCEVQQIKGTVPIIQVQEKAVNMTILPFYKSNYYALLWYPLILLCSAMSILVLCVCPPFAGYMHYPERALISWPELLNHGSVKPPGKLVTGSFLFDLAIIAAFYGVPALQVIYNAHEKFLITGDQDICWYNFRCIRPLGPLLAFNNIYSNLSYVVYGTTFLLIVRFNSKKFEWRYREIFYAMGVALVLEGVFSGAYHVCPNADNFQFDTTFMYIIAGLCTYHLYQIRNPRITGHPYKFYGIFAVAIIFVILSIVTPQDFIWQCVLSVFYGITALLLGGLILRRLFLKNEAALHHTTCLRFMLGLQTGANLLLLAYGLWSILKDPDSFSGVLLNVFVGNLFLYTAFYFTIKALNRERVVLGPLLSTILALGSWGTSLYFYNWRITNWALPAAQSRAQNEECIFLDYFDYHDVWHFLSAFSLYVSFVLLLTLDYGQKDIGGKELGRLAIVARDAVLSEIEETDGLERHPSVRTL